MLLIKADIFRLSVVLGLAFGTLGSQVQILSSRLILQQFAPHTVKICVALHNPQILNPEYLCNLIDIPAGLYRTGGESMSEGVECKIIDTCPFNSRF